MRWITPSARWLCVLSLGSVVSAFGADGAATLDAKASVTTRIPPPPRVTARRQQSLSEQASRAAHLRAAQEALGLHDLTIGGGDSGFAIYGKSGSGSIGAATASEAAESFVRAFAPVYGSPSADVADLVKSERRGFLPGSREIVITRNYRGRPLFGARLRLHLGANREFLAAVGDLHGDLEWAGEPAVGRSAALARARAAIDGVLKPEGRGPVRGADSEHATAGEVAYPIGPEARPAWLIEGVIAANGVDRFDVVVDGITGETLEIISRTQYAQGQVFSSGSGIPTSPQPSATPGTTPPTPNPPAYITRVTIPFTISGTTVLEGNNAKAREYQAWVGQSLTPSSGTAITEASGNFSFPLTLSSSSDVRQYYRATGTNLFYVLNYARDYFYGFGFDEAHGNFQVNNFGLGGLGNDPVVGLVQLGSGTANGNSAFASFNAFMSTPNDGTSPIMGMYVWGSSGSPPNRIYITDSALDPDIVLHEFMHGVTARLGPILPYTAQSGALNEGNSDFFALNMQIPASAPSGGKYPVATYSAQSFTFGIRTYPYSTSMATNPLTYANLGKVDAFGPEVHADGEIWANALWEARAGLVSSIGYAAGTEVIAQLVLDALQLMPDFPTFVDFRNAIVVADELRYGGSHTSVLWTAFAKRGLGALAAGGFDSYSLRVLSDTTSPSNAARVRLWESGFVEGELVRVLVADDNAATSNVTFTTTGGDSEALALVPRPGGAFEGEIPSQYGPPITNDGILQIIGGQTITATTTDSNTGGGSPTLSANATARFPYDVTVQPTSQFNASDATTLLLQGDEAVIAVNLPFTFPFYGTNQSQVRVGTNGLLSFDVPLYIRQRGLGVPGVPPLIAPFSADLDCRNANAVYYHSAVDRFTVRWACVEWSAPANAINVAVTLSPNGSFRFDYGTGNVLTGNDFYTGLPEIATVGLDRGTETFAQPVPGYDTSKNLASAKSVLFAPSTGAPPVAPASVTAGATNSASILVSWPAAAGSTAYRVERRDATGVYTQVAQTTGTSYTDIVPSNIAFLYRVRSVKGSAVSSPTNPDLATSVFFTGPLALGATIRGAHLSELRAAVAAVRNLASLSPLTFTGSATPGSLVRAAQINELRTGLNDARTALGLPAATFTGPALVLGDIIKALHFLELRSGVQ